MQAGPETPIEAPALRPAPLGLLQAATVIEHAVPTIDPATGATVGDEHWVAGIRWTPPNLSPPDLVDICAGTAVPNGHTRRGPRAYYPVAVEEHDRCSAVGLHDAAEYVARATSTLLAKEQWAVEQEFEQGTLSAANPHLADATDPFLETLNGGTAVSPKTAVALLDEAIANAGLGQGMIHLTAYVWAKYVEEVTGPAAQKYTSPGGNVIVVGAGYQGIGPDGTGGSARRSVFADGQIVAGTLGTLVSADGVFRSSDVGKSVVIVGAGVAAAPLSTTVATFVDANHVTLTTPASGAVGPNAVYFVTRTGTVDHANQWAYATDLVEVHRSDRPTISPQTLAEATDRATNVVVYRASRLYALAWNGLLHAAVKVDATAETSTGGGEPIAATVTGAGAKALSKAVVRQTGNTTRNVPAGRRSYTVAVVAAASAASPTLDGVALPVGASVSFGIDVPGDTLPAATLVTVTGDDVLFTETF